MRRLTGIASLVVTLAFVASAAAATTVLRLNGIGPLKLGMSQRAALSTGWLAHRSRGCPLGGPVALPVVYQFRGPRAPTGLTGSAQFDQGKLSIVTVGRGARTQQGVTIGSSAARAVKRYRAAGFSAKTQFSPDVAATFLTVTRHSKTVPVLMGIVTRGRVTSLSVPFVAACD
jgi:hypothetical protein